MYEALLEHIDVVIESVTMYSSYLSWMQDRYLLENTSQKHCNELKSCWFNFHYRIVSSVYNILLAGYTFSEVARRMGSGNKIVWINCNQLFRLKNNMHNLS